MLKDKGRNSLSLLGGALPSLKIRTDVRKLPPKCGSARRKQMNAKDTNTEKMKGGLRKCLFLLVVPEEGEKESVFL